MSSPQAIALSELSKNYGKRTGVEGLSLNVAKGAIFGFLGPNGAGKTTTIRVLVGLLRPTSGDARVFGIDCWRDGPAVRRQVGYLSGDVRLYPDLTCRSALRMASAIRRQPVEDHGFELAEQLDLDPGVPVQQMSRGMRQKLGLILALAHRPDLLILDEPTASLDPIIQSRLYEYLRACTARGQSVFLSSHTLSEVEQLADRVAILRKGRLVAEDDIASLRRRAMRAVSITWKSDAAPTGDPPSSLEWTERRGRTWHGRLKGTAEDIVRWSASQPIEDLTIGEPDLGAIFRAYYV